MPVEAKHKERCLARAGRLIIVRDGRRACRIGEEEPMRAAITASGHHVPDDVYPNSYFEGRLDTTDEWIRSRTGIVERRLAAGGGTSDLAVPAAQRCLDRRGISPAAVDCIIVATMTPDRLCPSTAAAVQRKLGAVNA